MTESPKQKGNPDALRIYLEETIPQQKRNAITARMMLEADESAKIIVATEFEKGYRHALGVIYTALELLNTRGFEQISTEHIREFRRGIEYHLTDRRT